DRPGLRLGMRALQLGREGPAGRAAGRHQDRGRHLRAGSPVPAARQHHPEPALPAPPGTPPRGDRQGRRGPRPPRAPHTRGRGRRARPGAGQGPDPAAEVTMRALLTVLAVVLGVSACSTPAPPRTAAGPAATPAGPAVLAAPTGPHPVGTTVLHLTDTSRPDPWEPDMDRELKVTLWYPARQRDGERAPYMTAKESGLVLRGSGIGGVPDDTLSRTRTNAVLDAEPAGRALDRQSVA